MPKGESNGYLIPYAITRLSQEGGSKFFILHFFITNF